MSGGHGAEQGGLRKILIVLLLVGGMVLLHRFGVRTTAFDPSAMLALGFVILSSYAFGQLLGRFGLPHLTGYILAGVLLGPYAVQYLPSALQIAPFDHGVLSESVIEQLRPFELLAVVLIAVTAGGEMRLSVLRQGFRSIAAMIAGHLLIVGPLAIGFVAAVSGVIPAVLMPGIPTLTTPQIVAMAVAVGAVVIATSPAATVAIVTETRARGPLTNIVMSAVVLMDVVIVVLFSIASTIAAQVLGLSNGGGGVGLYLLQHIGGSIVAGGLVGLGMIAYLRYVKTELLLFIIATAFAGALLAHALSLEPVLLFITAGFVITNFSSEGERFHAAVERLFLPISVVFFTLAGAHLRIDILIALAPFALTMVVIRGVGIYVGTRLGLRLARAEDVVRRLAWTGFVPQAGVAIALAGLVGKSFGELGATFETLLIAGIAINEVIGPVLLKIALGRAGETGGEAEARELPAPAGPEDAPAPPLPGTVLAVGAWGAPLPPYPADEPADVDWGEPLDTGSLPLDAATHELEVELGALAERLSEPLERFREAGFTFVHALQQESLRLHRRVTLQLLAEEAERPPAQLLQHEQPEFATRWRAVVFARANEVLGQTAWDPEPLLESAEAATAWLPELLQAPYPADCFEARRGDSVPTAFARWWLRAARWVRARLRRPMAARTVELRALARWHLWGLLPEELEPVAALHAQAEVRLVDRVRGVFEGLDRAYDALATELGAVGMERSQLEERLLDIRRQVEQELMTAVQEVDRSVEEAGRRTRSALGACIRGLKEDAARVATPDLPMRRRAASSIVKRRGVAFKKLVRSTAIARELPAALYSRLALELELVALEGRVQNALDEHATTLARDVHGRAHRQVERVQEALAQASTGFAALLASESTCDGLSQGIHEVCDPIVRVAEEAGRVATSLQHQLTDERAVSPLLDVMTRAARGLSDRYRIPAGPVQTSADQLPASVDTVEVPFREWVLTRIETTLAPRLLASTKEVAKRVEPLAQALKELKRRMAFKVELATSELSVLDSDAPPPETSDLLRDMIGSALERHSRVFAEYGEEARGWGEEVRRSVHDAVLTGLGDLRTGIMQGELKRLRLELARGVRGRRVRRILRDTRRSLGRSSVMARRALVEGIGETRIDRLRARFGLPLRQHEGELGPETFAPKAPAASLPVVYRRLFSLQALEAGDILTERDEVLDRALAVLEGRGPGVLRTLALVGPDGVGKSPFISAVIRGRRWPKVRELSLDRPATVDDVDELFKRETEGHLIVVRELQWLRSLAPDGFAPLRRLLHHIMADGGRNAFLVRADELIWAQCAQVAPLESVFVETVQLMPLDLKDLTAAMLARHTVSGLGLTFGQGMIPESRLEEAVQRAMVPLGRPQEAFFRALHASSGGLLRDALRLWLGAIERVDEATDLAHLGPVEAPAIYALRRLDARHELVLYQVARQGWMSVAVLAHLFGSDATAAEAQLQALAYYGILEPRGAVFHIAPHLRGATSLLLRERGYVP